MDLYDIPFDRMDGSTATLAEHREDVVMVVNVASRCGLTPQYTALEQLQQKYADRGFTVVGFPSNQFFQELSSDEKIAAFCSATYGVTFPVVSKVKVNGRKAHPLYQELTKTPDAGGHDGRIRWNFEKFLVLPGGEVRRYAPQTVPDDPEIVEVIEAHLPR
ncbi:MULTISPECIES: glutathione peroxidase [unclassified Isoptericola]|uniref:glutathione peroxidase n=1 Tax=unclassified Isoptericola TaxID=2623355 RepID=UPI002713B56B|nr:MULTISPECIES: glutathione peroxidase [unclassified Isoptericola]MDO8147001.1 glutathione peroxidase [Isoptericola sp. b515]MDO8150684.1 glutathione peroxidase [Isoptericola sp. b408]